ncbi:MAG: prolyl oligopeptidase family serine peptidase [Bryobacteraceae bacterium]
MKYQPAARLLSVCLLFALIAVPQTAKRPIHHKDYDGWRSIATQDLTTDGKVLVYAIFPQEGDGELVVKELASGKERHENMGALPPPPLPSEDGPNPEDLQNRAARIRITHDNHYALAPLFPSRADVEKAKKDKKPAPKNGLLIADLSGATPAVRIADVETFQIPDKGDAWVAYKKAAKNAPPAADAAKEPSAPENNDAASAEDQRRGGGAGAAGGAGRRTFGTELVLRNLASGAEKTMEDVSEFALARDGKLLVYAVASRKDDTNGVYTVTPGTDGAPTALLSGKGKYSRPVFDREQAKVSFLSDRGEKKFEVYLWDRKSAPTPVVTASVAAAKLKQGCGVSDKAQVSFSRDGSKLYFPCAYPTPPAAAAVAAEDKVTADLWSYKDDYVQPMQKVRAAQERNRSYRAMIDLASNTVSQVTDPTLQQAYFTDDGRAAVGTDDRALRSMVDFDGSYANFYLIDTATGSRKLLFEKQRSGGGGGGGGFGAGPVTWSPTGKAFLLFRDNNWHSVSVPSGVVTNLTGAMTEKFFNEENDSPAAPGNYGQAGWTKDGAWVLVNDHYDVWAISPDGKASKNLTGGMGRREHIQFRVQRLDRDDPDEEDRGIDPAKLLLLHAENQLTRDAGYYSIPNLNTATPHKLIWGPRNYRAVLKAKDADVVLMTASTFHDEPNLQVTDLSFRNPKQVTEMNPQKAGMLWGTSELMKFRNVDGVPLEAAVYKPENFDPKRKYPVMVYIYERLSQNVHQFVAPKPGHSVNFAYYVSNGYIILTPDIIYNVGSPGQSALKCVLPAIQALADQGFVNENAIGIQGHSWGGYQIAYMVTQTIRFKAAEAGAPVGNMTSAYNGIRWGSGMPRQFQYEKTQSRIGGTIWDHTLNFIENSPVFHADKVQTPLLILHDDNDDAVPWYQGIEFFLALRRLGKEAYLWNYNGEFHGLRRRPDQKDYTLRMQQFFDYLLKDAQKPEWMEKGVPYTEREQEKEKTDATYKQ